MPLDRLRVFVSSKMEELREERRHVRAALDALLVDAWVFESDAGARAETIQQTYLDEVEKADLYLGIFWKDHGDRTLEEFEHARRHGKDCLIFEKRTGLEARSPVLQAFLDRITDVEGGLTVRWFHSPAELREYVKQDVAAWQTRQIRKRAAAESILSATGPVTGVDLSVLPGVRPAGDRTAELPAIDRALHDPLCRIFVITGLGGTGKSAFVKAWIQHAIEKGSIASDEVVSWTFQPIGNGQTVSEHAFFEMLRRRFGLPARADPAAAEAIVEAAREVTRRRTLLVLDAFEALLGGGSRGEEKTILHPFKLLLAHLDPAGLCIITTRIEPSELMVEGPPAVQMYSLEGLAVNAGVAILRDAGVAGGDEDLRAVVEAYEGHPLALTLLAQYLVRLRGEDVPTAGALPPLASSPGAVDRIRGIVNAYTEQLARTGPELMPVLQAITAFDDGGREHPLRLFVNRRPRSPEGRVLAELDLARWRDTIQQLRSMRLISLGESPTGDRVVETHLLIRQAVREATQRRSPEFWREINAFLAEWFQNQADENDGYERVELLCRAVVHRCRAGAPNTAFREIYAREIMPGVDQSVLRRLGRFSAVAAATRALDEASPTEPGEELSDADRVTVLGHQGTCVMALYGHTVPELEEILLRIDDLARGLGTSLERAYANWMLHSYYLVTGRLDKTERIAGTLARQAGREHSPVIDLLASERLGSTRFYQGRFGECRELLTGVLERLESGTYDLTMPDATILDPRTVCNLIVAGALAVMGDNARSQAHRTAAIERVEAAGDPITAALVYLLASRISHLQEMLHEAHQLATRVLSLAEAHQMVLWRALGIIQAKGYGALLHGPSPESIAQMVEALAKYQAIGGQIAVPYCLGLIGTCRHRAGDHQGAVHDLNQGIRQALDTGEHWYLAELYRLRGECAGTSEDFLEANRIASQQDARLFSGKLLS